jgi:hypothetical protein
LQGAPASPSAIRRDCRPPCRTSRAASARRPARSAVGGGPVTKARERPSVRQQAGGRLRGLLPLLAGRSRRPSGGARGDASAGAAWRNRGSAPRPAARPNPSCRSARRPACCAAGGGHESAGRERPSARRAGCAPQRHQIRGGQAHWPTICVSRYPRVCAQALTLLLEEACRR